MRSAAGKYGFQISLLLAVVLITGPIGNFPIGDDWQYAYPVMTWVERGHIEFNGIFAPNILLQVAWGYLFCKIGGGFDFTWLRLSTLVAGFVAVLYFYKILRELGVEKTMALPAALSLAFNPLFYYLSFTFFTDVPFLALCLMSIYFFQKYLSEQRGRFMGIAIVCAVGSFYIRQPGLLLLPSFVLFFLVKNRFAKPSFLSAFLLVALAAAVYFSLEKWVKPALGISGNFVPVSGKFYAALVEQPISTVSEWIKKGVKTFVYLGFFSLPLLPLFWNKITEAGLARKRVLATTFLLNITLFLLLFKIGKTFPFGGNILFNFGLGSELLADVYTLGLHNTPHLPDWTMLLVQFISQLSTTFLFLFVFKKFKKLKEGQKQFIWFLLILNLMYLPLMSITSFFDRYLLLPVASFFMILSISYSGKFKIRPSLKWLPFVAIAAFSILATGDSMRWNKAKNKAFLFLSENGVPITEMDAGYEYNGFYNYHFPRVEKQGQSFWWVTDNRYMITFGPVPGYRQIASFPYHRWLYLKDDAILVLEREE